MILVSSWDIGKAGMRSLLMLDPDVVLVCTCSTVAEGLALVKRHRPHVVLVDLDLPSDTGIQLCRSLRDLFPRTQVLVWISLRDDSVLSNLSILGASGFVLKSATRQELLTAVRTVAQGHIIVDPITPNQPTAEIRELTTTQLRAALAGLTPREKDILPLLVQGRTNKEIAEALVISDKTVRNHISNLLHKLNLRRRSDAAVLAVGMTLID